MIRRRHYLRILPEPKRKAVISKELPVKPNYLSKRLFLEYRNYYGRQEANT